MANSKKGTKQVNPPTPKQRVNAAFGGKAALVDEIMKLSGVGDADVRSKLMQVSNTRLISHHHNAKRMVAAYGSREGLIEAICAKKFPKGNVDEHFRTAIEGFSPWRLVDLDRQVEDLQKKDAKEAERVAKLARARKARRDKLRRRRVARRH